MDPRRSRQRQTSPHLVWPPHGMPSSGTSMEDHLLQEIIKEMRRDLRDLKADVNEIKETRERWAWLSDLVFNRGRQAINVLVACLMFAIVILQALSIISPETGSRLHGRLEAVGKINSGGEP